jgi:hypothetical protein
VSIVKGWGCREEAASVATNNQPYPR